jgi:hypothetical protein
METSNFGHLVGGRMPRRPAAVSFCIGRRLSGGPSQQLPVASSSRGYGGMVPYHNIHTTMVVRSNQ